MVAMRAATKAVIGAAPVIGVDTVGGFINYVLVGFVWKTLMETVMLPVTAMVIKWVKSREDYQSHVA